MDEILCNSAYQVEEGAHDDGKGLSIWDTFCSIPGKIVGGANGDFAADAYRRYKILIGSTRGSSSTMRTIMEWVPRFDIFTFINGIMKQCCQICGMNTHLADGCPFLYTSCTMVNCTGIRKLKISGSINNPGRKYLRCQFRECNGFEWLDEAVLQRAGIASSSNQQGCFSCEEFGHWTKDCPWKTSPCFKPGCNGVRLLSISNSVNSKGERYLKCPKCDCFEGLKDARAQEKENERKRGTKQKFVMMAVNEEATIEEISSHFKQMMSL